MRQRADLRHKAFPSGRNHNRIFQEGCRAYYIRMRLGRCEEPDEDASRVRICLWLIH